MRTLLIVNATCIALVGAILPAGAQERTMTGAAIGAGVGAVVLGPVGAVAGGAIGAAVGGPGITTRGRYICRYDRRGRRHCRWR
jgi:osmotically inducible lipoprotein OsmB